MMASKNNKVLRVNEAADARVREHAKAHGVSVSEAANALIMGVMAETPPPSPLSADLTERLTAYATAKGLTRDEALSAVLVVGFKRIEALGKWIVRKKSGYQDEGASA